MNNRTQIKTPEDIYETIRGLISYLLFFIVEIHVYIFIVCNFEHHC